MTIVKEHGLLLEGLPRYDSNGVINKYWRRGDPQCSAKCRCGALSPPGITQQAAKRWHRQHKIEVGGQ